MQLHYRIKQVKSTRESCMFGMFVVGDLIEVYCRSLSKGKWYSFILLKKITLPTLKTTYTSLEESLEILFSSKINLASYHNTDRYWYLWKIGINRSQQHSSDCGKPYIYHEYHNYFKPTVSFISSSDRLSSLNSHIFSLFYLYST